MLKRCSSFPGLFWSAPDNKTPFDQDFRHLCKMRARNPRRIRLRTRDLEEANDTDIRRRTANEHERRISFGAKTRVKSWLAGYFICCLVADFVAWFVWLVDWLVGWFVGYLVGCFLDWLAGELVA